MNFDMYTMERRLEMTLPVQANLNTSIGSTRLVTLTEQTVNTYMFPLLLPNRGKIHVFTLAPINDSTQAMPSSPIHWYEIRLTSK